MAKQIKAAPSPGIIISVKKIKKGKSAIPKGKLAAVVSAVIQAEAELGA